MSAHTSTTRSGQTIDSKTVTEVVLPGIVEPEGLLVTTRILNAPGAGQVRVAVDASGVSFAEQQMRRGKYYDQPAFPFVPGYDLVGTVTVAGPGVDPAVVGRRYAALTKTGAWSSDVVVDADVLVPVPAGLDPAEAETLVVNGISAWQLLHRIAKVHVGSIVLVHGANGGVGSTLVQLARLAGARVIGTAAPRHHHAVRALGATPVDYRDPDLPARVRELAPNGVDAVFDHVGGPGIVDSYRLLARGGVLVSYGSASTKNEAGHSQKPILALIARLVWWNTLPNGRRARFFNVWSGRRNRAAFHARIREDLGQVFTLLLRGELTTQVAARVPLHDAAHAMRLAESGAVTGKVVLVPQRRPTAQREFPR